ncbi:MAG TPA: hypothetical protein VIG33_17665 [Pseudobdellovibrionaceae bacterium]|jgi:hypothetical protein
MKIFFASLIILGIPTEQVATAAAVHPTQKFITSFIQSVNDRLETVNMERAIAGNRLYCSQLSDQQVKDIENLFISNPSAKANQFTYRSLDKVTIGQFITAAADNLGCYPTFWPTKGRSTIGGVLFNSKAFVMDHLLLQEALAALAGHATEDNQTLNTVLR